VDENRDDPIINVTGTGWAGRRAVPRYAADENALEPSVDALEDGNVTVDLGDLELRVEALENLNVSEERVGLRDDDLGARVQALEEHVSRGGGYVWGSGFYSVGAALAVVLSWQTFHALLWAILAGSLSWFYVIYFVVMHWGEVKFL
jgi:hypothetical protein